MAENHFLRSLVIDRVLLEAHAQGDRSMGDLKVNLTSANESPIQEWESVKHLTEEGDEMKRL